MQTFLWSAQDLRGGGRSRRGQPVRAARPGSGRAARLDREADGRSCAPCRGLTDVSSDQDRAGPQANVVIDRVAAARLGVSVIGDRRCAEQRLRAAADLHHLHRRATSTGWCWRSIRACRPTRPASTASSSAPPAGSRCRCCSVVRLERGTAPLAVRHQGQFPAATISFNTAPGVAQGDALAAVQQAARDLRMPETVRTAVRRQRAVADAEPGTRSLS